MNRLTLDIAALAAKSHFGKTELVGYYHNEGLYYVLSRIKGPRKANVSQIKDLIIEFFTTLPANTFGKLSKRDQKNLAKRVLDEINLDEISGSFVWKSHPELSGAANQSISALLKLVESFIDTDMNPVKAKAQLEQWQDKLEHKTLNSRERIVLSGAGSIARYSLTYWLLNEPLPNLPTETLFKIRIGPVAADIAGGLMGGLIGFGFGGPGGAVVGGMAGGHLASAAV